MKKHIFISHSSLDAEVASEICAILEKNSINCWIAPRDIRIGFSYDEEIIEGINSTEAIIVLISKNSNESKHVKRELELADKYDHPIFPVRINNVPIGKKLEYYCTGKQYTDVFEPPLENKLKYLTQILKKELKIKEITEPTLNKQKNTEKSETKKEVELTPEISYGEFIDERDKKKYKTIKIGAQTWLAENLAYKTNNSTIYKNDAKLGEIYGKLYQWHEIFEACPNGWKIPDYEDWEKLIALIGDKNSAGKQLKNAGTEFWKLSNADLQNKYGFSALPGGMRVENTYGYMGSRAYFWSADEYNAELAWRWSISGDKLSRTYEQKDIFYSLRCIKINSID